jgi:hypothetical protein
MVVDTAYYALISYFWAPSTKAKQQMHVAAAKQIHLCTHFKDEIGFIIRKKLTITRLVLV